MQIKKPQHRGAGAVTSERSGLLRLHLFKELLHAVEETGFLRRVAVAVAAIEALLQLAKQVFLLVVEVDGRFQHHFAQQVAGGATANGLHAFTA